MKKLILTLTLILFLIPGFSQELKLTFESKKEFNRILAQVVDTNFLIPAKATYTATLKTGERITVVNVGHVPIPATYDEQGKILTEASQYEDWAVDILSPVKIPEFEDYKVKNKPEHWHHKFK